MKMVLLPSGTQSVTSIYNTPHNSPGNNTIEIRHQLAPHLRHYYSKNRHICQEGDRRPWAGGRMSLWFVRATAQRYLLGSISDDLTRRVACFGCAGYTDTGRSFPRRPGSQDCQPILLRLPGPRASLSSAGSRPAFPGSIGQSISLARACPGEVSQPNWQ